MGRKIDFLEEMMTLSFLRSASFHHSCLGNDLKISMLNLVVMFWMFNRMVPCLFLDYSVCQFLVYCLS